MSRRQNISLFFSPSWMQLTLAHYDITETRGDGEWHKHKQTHIMYTSYTHAHSRGWLVYSVVVPTFMGQFFFLERFRFLAALMSLFFHGQSVNAVGANNNKRIYIHTPLAGTKDHTPPPLPASSLQAFLPPFFPHTVHNFGFLQSIYYHRILTIPTTIK